MTRVSCVKQERGVIPFDMLSAFDHTELSQSDERIIMKARGALAGMLLEIAPSDHQDFSIVNAATTFVRSLKVPCIMIVASTSLFEKLRK